MVALMVSAIALAQTTGKVVDAENNQPLPGATVVVKGTKKGTVTDFDGNFSIDASTGDMLEVSFLVQRHDLEIVIICYYGSKYFVRTDDVIALSSTIIKYY